MPLPKELQILVDDLQSNRTKPIYEMTAIEYREMLAEFEVDKSALAPNITSQDRNITGSNSEISLRVYKPVGNEEKARPAIIYLLGGGFIQGNLESQDGHCRVIADRTNSTVISVAYRLAPEYQFPLGFNDAYDATKWIFNNADKLKIDKKQISICGFSSGGNYAALVAIKAKNEGISIAKQVLVSPCLDFSRSQPSHTKYSEGFLLDQKDLDWHFNHYVPEDVDLKDPHLSPFWSEDLGGLPKTLVITAQYCPFRDEGKLYSEKLASHGVDVELSNYEDLHVGFTFSIDKLSDEHNQLNEICEFLSASKKLLDTDEQDNSLNISKFSM